MDKKEVLYFEEDDASNISKNGKHVFLTKRINGKTTHNKLQNQGQEQEQKINNINDEEEYNPYEDIIIGVNNASFLERQRQEEKQAKIEKKKQEKLAKKRRKQNKKKNKSNSAEKQEEQDTELIYNTKVSSNNLRNSRRKSNSTNVKTIKSKNSGKPKKKKKKKLKILKILVLLFIIAGVIIFAMVSPIFNISTITVSGNERVRTDTVISLSELTIGSNIFRNSKNQIKQKIKENQYVEGVNIKRKLPGTIDIEIKEREVAYQIQVIDSYIYINYQGYILEIANQKENVPIIKGFSTSDEEFLNEKRVNDEDISTLNDILKIMESAKNIEFANKITEINVENQKDYILTVESEKKEVYIGDASNLNNKMLYVQIILKEEKKSQGKIFVNGDLTRGFKPYFDKAKK